MPLDYHIARLEYFWVTNNTVLEEMEIIELGHKNLGKAEKDWRLYQKCK